MSGPLTKRVPSAVKCNPSVLGKTGRKFDADKGGKRLQLLVSAE